MSCNVWCSLLLLAVITSCNFKKDSNYELYNSNQLSERFTYKVIKDFSSEYVGFRTVEIFAPISTDQGETYPVLYMLDGQEIFHPSMEMEGAASSTLNIDGIIDSLSFSGELPKMIVVGIFHTPLRMSNYMPEKPRALLNQRIAETSDPFFRKFQDNPPSSDNELRFITQELKPFIDSTYQTKPDHQNTFIAGWSVGALLSTYAICEYPNTFGGAMNFSPYWLAFDGAFIEYLKDNLPDPDNHRLYFDYGKNDLKNNYKILQESVDEAIVKRNFTKNKNWKVTETKFENGLEKDWSTRVSEALLFLFQ